MYYSVRARLFLCMPEVASLLEGKQVTGLALGEVNVQNACLRLLALDLLVVSLLRACKCFVDEFFNCEYSSFCLL